MLSASNTPAASSVLVRQSAFFSSLPSTLVNEMAREFRLEEWGKKHYATQEQLLTRFYIILDGKVEILRTNPETGREVTLDLLQAGDGFDVVVLLDNKPHDVIVSPLSSCKLISVSMQKMRQWIWSYPELNRQFIPYLGRKLREQEDQTTDFALYDTVTRLSRTLLKNLDRRKLHSGATSDSHSEHLITGLSDDVIARMIGSVRQVVNKQLQHWKKEGIIDKKRGQIVINDLEALSEEAELTDLRYR